MDPKAHLGVFEKRRSFCRCRVSGHRDNENEIYVELQKIRRNRLLLGISHRTARLMLRPSLLLSGSQSNCSRDCCRCPDFAREWRVCFWGDRCVRLTAIQLLTFRGLCIVMYSCNESQRDALFLRFI